MESKKIFTADDRIAVYSIDDIAVCEVLLEGELTTDDLDNALGIINETMNQVHDMIIIKKSEYSVSLDSLFAMPNLFLLKGLQKLAYVADTLQKKSVAKVTIDTFFTDINAEIFSTTEDAVSWVKSDK